MRKPDLKGTSIQICKAPEFSEIKAFSRKWRLVKIVTHAIDVQRFLKMYATAIHPSENDLLVGWMAVLFSKMTRRTRTVDIGLWEKLRNEERLENLKVRLWRNKLHLFFHIKWPQSFCEWKYKNVSRWWIVNKHTKFCLIIGYFFYLLIFVEVIHIRNLATICCNFSDYILIFM